MKKIVCIYRIRSKIDPELSYIGSTSNFNSRIKDHIHFLKSNKHGSKLMQEHFNKYGLEDLEFSILKECILDHLEFWEQYYLSNLKPKFNSDKFAGISGNLSGLARTIAMKDIDLSHKNKEIERGNLLTRERLIMGSKSIDLIKEKKIPINI